MRVSARGVGAATSGNPPTRPRRPRDQSAGEGLSALAPLTALQWMKTPPTRRTICEGGAAGAAARERVQQLPARGRVGHRRAAARSLRRCSCIPSPPHLPSPRRPGVGMVAPCESSAPFSALRGGALHCSDTSSTQAERIARGGVHTFFVPKKLKPSQQASPLSRSSRQSLRAGRARRDAGGEDAGERDYEERYSPDQPERDDHVQRAH